MTTICPPPVSSLKIARGAPDDASPVSFRVTCGAIRLYVVQRLLGVAKEGIQIRKAVLPAGRRKLAGIFTDTLGRKVQRFVALMEC